MKNMGVFLLSISLKPIHIQMIQLPSVHSRNAKRSWRPMVRNLAKRPSTRPTSPARSRVAEGWGGRSLATWILGTENGGFNTCGTCQRYPKTSKKWWCSDGFEMALHGCQRFEQIGICTAKLDVEPRVSSFSYPRGRNSFLPPFFGGMYYSPH